MNLIKYACMMLVCSLLSLSPANAVQEGASKGFEMPGSFQHAFHSDILGDDFSIVVSVPIGYGQPDKTYPLLFALDGDGMFGMESDVPRLLSFEGKVPQMIVASVVYGGMQQWFQKRMRDFHSANGGAERFLEAMKGEIIPFLLENYPINADDKALYGHSSAGLFAVYAAVKEPQLFNRILATSPSLEEEPPWAATFLDMIASNSDGLPKIYMSVDASEAAMIEAVKPHVAALAAKLGESRFKYEILDEGSHMSVIPKAYNAGLHFLYTQ